MANIIGANGIAIGDGQGGYIATDIKTMVLENLHQNMSAYLQARSAYSGDLIGNGTIAYRIPLYGSTRAYSNGQQFKDIPQVEVRQISVSDYRTQVYELETFDLSQIENGAALQGKIAANLATTISADLDAHFLKTIQNFVDKTPSANFYLPELSQRALLTQEQLMYVNNWLAVKQNDLRKTITKKYIGVKGSEFFGLMDCTALKNIRMLLTGLNASNLAFDTLLKGIGGDTLDKYNFNGLTILIDNFINMNLPEGYNFNGDYELNIDSLAFILHREAIAFPMGLNSIVSVINTDNGNPKWIAKYCFGSGVIRPELVLGFTSKKELTQADEDAQKVSVGEIVFLKFFGEGREGNTTWTTTKGVKKETADGCAITFSGTQVGDLITVTANNATAGLKATYKFKVIA